MIVFENRVVQFPNRVKLSPVEGKPNVYDVSRQEGNVLKSGTALNAENINQIYKDCQFDFYSRFGGDLQGDLVLPNRRIIFKDADDKKGFPMYAVPEYIKTEGGFMADQLYDGLFQGKAAKVFSERNRQRSKLQIRFQDQLPTVSISEETARVLDNEVMYYIAGDQTNYGNAAAFYVYAYRIGSTTYDVKVGPCRACIACLIENRLCVMGISHPSGDFSQDKAKFLVYNQYLQAGDFGLAVSHSDIILNMGGVRRSKRICSRREVA